MNYKLRKIERTATCNQQFKIECVILANIIAYGFVIRYEHF